MLYRRCCFQSFHVRDKSLNEHNNTRESILESKAEWPNQVAGYIYPFLYDEVLEVEVRRKSQTSIRNIDVDSDEEEEEKKQHLKMKKRIELGKEDEVEALKESGALYRFERIITSRLLCDEIDINN